MDCLNTALTDIVCCVSRLSRQYDQTVDSYKKSCINIVYSRAVLGEWSGAAGYGKSLVGVSDVASHVSHYFLS